jgi:hypothetical protein
MWRWRDRYGQHFVEGRKIATKLIRLEKKVKGVTPTTSVFPYASPPYYSKI